MDAMNTNMVRDDADETPAATILSGAQVAGLVGEMAARLEQFEALLASGALEASSLMQVAAYRTAAGQPLPEVPGLPVAPAAVRMMLDSFDLDLERLKSALGSFEMTGISKALAELQFDVDRAFLALGLGRVKATLIENMMRAKMGQQAAE